MARANSVEHLTITATDNNSKAGNFSAATDASIEGLIIQNTSANDCYITWAKSAAPTAVNTNYLLLAGASLEMDNHRFIYFAGINKTNGANFTIVVSGNYS